MEWPRDGGGICPCGGCLAMISQLALVCFYLEIDFSD